MWLIAYGKKTDDEEILLMVISTFCQSTQSFVNCFDTPLPYMNQSLLLNFIELVIFDLDLDVNLHKKSKLWKRYHMDLSIPESFK